MNAQIKSWDEELELRRNAVVGELFDFGPTNFGRDRLVLPITEIIKTRLICSDGRRTERIMIGSGKIVARPLGYACKYYDEG